MGDAGAVTPSEDRFEQFWRAYPRRVGKRAAWAVWLRLRVDEALLARMLATLAWQRQEWDDLRFIPHPRTWLSQGRWEDEPLTAGDVVPARAGKALPLWARGGQ